MSVKITNYGKILAEIIYFERNGNDKQVERLTALLEQAREKDKAKAKAEAKKELTNDIIEENLFNESHFKDEVKK